MKEKDLNLENLVRKPTFFEGLNIILGEHDNKENNILPMRLGHVTLDN